MFNNANVAQPICQNHLAIILESKLAFENHLKSKLTFENHLKMVTSKINKTIRLPRKI